MRPWKHLLLSAAFVCNTTFAAQFCATNSAELQTHLDTAALNGQDDVIRLETGTYTDNYTYSSIQPGGDAFDLTLDGGYTQFMGTPCGRRQTLDPSATIIDAGNGGRGLFFDGRTGTSLHIFGIGFINGVATTDPQNRGGAIKVTGCCSGDMAELTIDNALFMANTAEFDSALSASFVDFISVRNSVFSENHATASQAVSIVVAGTGSHFINNTVVNNTAAGGGGAGAYFAPSGTAEALVVNSIFWGNDNTDLRALTLQPVYVYNSTVDQFSGQAEEYEANVAIAPEFQAGPLNFKLAPDSPLLDAGREPPLPIITLPFEDDWDLPTFDYEGNDRILGQTVDIGAVETTPDRLFFNGFEAAP